MSTFFSHRSYSHSSADSLGDDSWWNGVYEAADLCRPAIVQDVLNRTLPQTSFLGYRAQHTNLHGQQCQPLMSPKVPTNSSDCISNSTSTRNSKGLYPSQLKKMNAKHSLNSGNEHRNSSGKMRRARYVKDGCRDKCSVCQKPRLKESDRQEIFNSFWSLSDHERQWLFIYGSVKTTAPKRKTSIHRGKLSTRSYFFTVCGKQRRVCKTMFKNTLCICNSWIDSALSHFSTNGFLPDMRGRRKGLVHGNPPSCSFNGNIGAIS